jgi:hypothetical protein
MKNETQKMLEERLGVAQQGLEEVKSKLTLAQKNSERVQKQKKEYERFRSMIADCDGLNQIKARKYDRNLDVSEYPSLSRRLLTERDEVANLLWHYQLYFAIKRKGIQDFDCPREMPLIGPISNRQIEKYWNLGDLARDYFDQIEMRTMDQETYESLLQGTEKTLGGYFPKIKQFTDTLRHDTKQFIKAVKYLGDVGNQYAKKYRWHDREINWCTEKRIKEE